MNELIATDFNGISVNFSNDGWFNATEVAKMHGKDVNEWARLPSTESYISALESKYGKIPYLKSKRGNNGGTWLHPKVAIVFARWISDEFAIWCDEKIESIVYGDASDEEKNKHEMLKSLMITKRDAHKDMMDALVEMREEQGKSTSGHHFINENKMCNWAVMGKGESVDELLMTDEEVKLFAFARKTNESLIRSGLPYQERKRLLVFAVESQRKSLRTKLDY